MPPIVPHATYRLQFTKDFGFYAAAAIVPYLKQLGVSHLYASPFLKARPGSTHGYDIVHHDRLNPELGGEEGFARLSATLKEYDLGLILDFVPNHMGVGRADNDWWLDVLEWGPQSPYAIAFDIDWNGLPHRRHPGVLLPVLGRPYGDALQAGEIELRYDPENGSFAAWYFEHKLPINPQRYGEMLRSIVAAASATETEVGRALLEIADSYRDPREPGYREAPALKQRLAAIDGAADIITRGLHAYRADTEAGAAALHRLLERQHYRVAYWRVAFSAINYRRFFDINDLAGLRVENPATFRAIHVLVSQLVAEDRLQGLRLDHIDGLRDPAQYTRRLSQLIRKLRREAGKPPGFYVLVEKILQDDEPMPRLPGVAGTTGYEWLNVISYVLADNRGLEPLERTWRAFTGETASLAAMLDDAKLRIIQTMLTSEFNVLSRALARIAAGHFSTRDFTADRLRAALQFYVREFPVYRTYLTAAGISEVDRRTIEGAIGRARARWRGPDPEVFDFLRDAVTMELAKNASYSAPRVREFAMKLQQFTGPLMAKSLEDTAFYRHHRLLAFNEVGGNPDAPAMPLTDFHARQKARAETSHTGLTATATHDTKRGEDARARILALTELSDEWNDALKDWQRLNSGLARHEGRKRLPSTAHEYMLYQALIGAWPDRIGASFTARMQAYAFKAAREGKQETSWTNPDEAYEDALKAYVGNLLDPAVSGNFIASFEKFASRTALLGALNGLSQVALKILLPGVPDLYQGTELWDLSLVDPDNRRPVDFGLRKDLLAEAGAADWRELAPHWRDGRVKLALTERLLRLRRANAELFENGTYVPLQATGPHAEHIVAFSRVRGRQQIVALIGRHFAPLTDGGRHWPTGWNAAVRLPGGRFVEEISGKGATHAGEQSIADLLSVLPICILRRA